jgi:hypothetical protein
MTILRAVIICVGVDSDSPRTCHQGPFTCHLPGVTPASSRSSLAAARSNSSASPAILASFAR